MRLWSIHPRYLDAKGLVALWREGLLAQAVLRGETKGYQNHPQLTRFKLSRDPLASIDCFLQVVYYEAQGRGYSFDANKLSWREITERLTVTVGQVEHEWNHLLGKLLHREPALHREHLGVGQPATHPLFLLVPGEVEAWERVTINRQTGGAV